MSEIEIYEEGGDGIELSQNRSDGIRNPVVVYLGSLGSDKSRRTSRYALRSIIKYMRGSEVSENEELEFPWWKLRYEHLVFIQSQLSEKFKPSTVNNRMSVVTGVLRECWKLGLMTIEDFELCRTLKQIKYEVEPAGRYVPDKEVNKLKLQCYSDGVIGVRDILFIGMLLMSGRRVEEIVGIKMEDIDFADSSIKILAKGNREGTIYINQRMGELLSDWLDLRGDHDGYLFLSVRRGGKISNNQFQQDSARKMLEKRTGIAEIDKITNHDFRRKLASDMMTKGVDEATIMRIAGWKSSRMLSRYDRRPEQRKRDVLDDFDFPI